MRLRKGKRQKSRANGPLKSFLRTANSSSNVFRGVSKARNKVQLKDIHLVIDTLIDNPLYSETIVTNPFPELNLLLDNRQRLTKANKETAFLWSACVVSKFSDELNSFILLKSKYEHSFTFGEYEKAKDYLMEIETTFNMSMWLINSKFEFLQRYESLKAQKSFLEEIVSVEGIDPIVAFFANFISSRNEEITSCEAYSIDIEGVAALPNIGSYATYHLIPFFQGEILNTTDVILYEEDNSIIDRFEALINMIEIEITNKNSELKPLINRILKILDKIQDPRIKKFSLLLQKKIQPENNNILSLLDEYTKGNYEFDTPLLVENIELLIRQALFNKSILKELSEKKSPFYIAAFEMCQMLSKTGDYWESKKILEKLRLTVARTDLAKVITAFLERKDNFYTSKNRTQSEHIYSLTLSFMNPWAISTIESLSSNQNYGISLKEHYPDSTALNLHLLMNSGYQAAKEIDSMEIPNYRKKLRLGYLAFMHGDYDMAEKLFDSIDITKNQYVASQVRENMVKVFMAQGKVLNSIEIVIEHYLEHPSSINSYPIEELIHQVEKEVETDGEAYQNISYCIFLSIASRIIHPKWEKNLSDVYENIIDRFEVDKPSQLKENDEGLDNSRLIYLLRYVAIPRILDDCTFFDSVDEIEKERIAICQMLLEIDPENGADYSSEIKIITTEAQITKMINHFNSGKIYVNEEGVLSYIKNSHQRMYSQYQELVKLPELNIQMDKISERLNHLLKSPEFDSIGLPALERVGLFEKLYKHVVQELAANAAYGLDTYLSTSIRHGSFEGQVRRAFDQYGLLITKKNKNGRSKLPDQWLEHFESLSDLEIKRILNRLEVFTKTTTEIIELYLSKLIQIKTIEDTQGLFDFSIKRDELENLRLSISKDSTYGEFIDVCLKSFWKSAESSMENIKSFIQSDLKIKILKALDKMANGVSADIEDSSFFHDAVIKSKTDFEVYVVELCEWFTQPEPQIIDDFSFDIAFGVAETQINHCYVAHNLSNQKRINVPIKIKGQYFTSIVEILFILIQNVVRHSLLEHINYDLNIINDNGSLQIKIENEFSDDVCLDELTQTIKKSNQQYKNGFEVNIAKSEGGSGLSKIWRILEHDMKVNHSLHLEIMNENKFVVNLNFNIKELIYEN